MESFVLNEKNALQGGFDRRFSGAREPPPPHNYSWTVAGKDGRAAWLEIGASQN